MTIDWSSIGRCQSMSINCNHSLISINVYLSMFIGACSLLHHLTEWACQASTIRKKKELRKAGLTGFIVAWFVPKLTYFPIIFGLIKTRNTLQPFRYQFLSLTCCCVHCVVLENINTPTREVTEIPRGRGVTKGSMPEGIGGGGGRGQEHFFPEGYPKNSAQNTFVLLLIWFS